MQIGDTIIYINVDVNKKCVSHNPKDHATHNIGIITRIDSVDDKVWARYADDTYDLHCSISEESFIIIPKNTPTSAAIQQETVDELCDLLVECAQEAHSLMQTKTLRRIQMMLKNLGKEQVKL